MSMGFLPPEATNDLYALLQVLTDPQRHKEALEALKEHAAESYKALDNAQAAQREAERLHEELDEKRAGLDNAKDSLNRYHQALDARQKDLDQREANLAAARKEHERHMVDLAAATKAHEAREIEIAEQERNAEKLIDHASKTYMQADSAKLAAEKLRQDYERRIAKLKELAG